MNRIIDNAGKKFLSAVLFIVLTAILLVFNIAFAFSYSLYCDMRFPTDNFCMLTIAQNGNRLINRNPPVFSKSDIEMILKDKSVQYASGYYLSGVSSVKTQDNISIDINKIDQVGNDFFRIMNITPYDGNFNLNNHHCVVGYKLSQMYNLLPGDRLQYTTQNGEIHSTIISAIMNELPPQKFSTLLSAFNNSLIISDNKSEQYVSVFVDIKYKNDGDLKKICSRIEAKLNSESTARDRITQYEQVVMHSKIDMKNTLNAIYDNFYVFIYLMTSLIVVICVLGVYSKISLMLIRSKNELSILKRIGADNNMIMTLLIPQLISIIFYPLILSLLLSTILQVFICKSMSFAITFDYFRMIEVVLFACFFMFISTIIAVHRVLKTIK